MPAEAAQEVSDLPEEVLQEHVVVHSIRNLLSEERRMKENSEQRSGIVKSQPDFTARRKNLLLHDRNLILMMVLHV